MLISSKIIALFEQIALMKWVSAQLGERCSPSYAYAPCLRHMKWLKLTELQKEKKQHMRINFRAYHLTVKF